MLHRDLREPVPPVDADVDTDVMAARAAAAERGDWHLRVLGEVAEISLTLVRSLGEIALARVEAAKAEARALSPEDDATLNAYSKATQTLRRTVALRDKLDKEATSKRESLLAERGRRRADLAANHARAKRDAVVEGLHDAYAAVATDEDYTGHVERLMKDAETYLDDADADEMRGWLDRPVGETVARLCAALDLDPDSCKPQGGTWRVRRPQRDFELRVDRRAAALAASVPASDAAAPTGLSP